MIKQTTWPGFHLQNFTQDFYVRIKFTAADFWIYWCKVFGCIYSASWHAMERCMIPLCGLLQFFVMSLTESLSVFSSNWGVVYAARGLS